MGRKRNPRTLSSRAQCILFSFSVCPPSNKSSSAKSCIMNAPCFHLEGSASSLDILLTPPSTGDHLCCQSSLGGHRLLCLPLGSFSLPPSVRCLPALHPVLCSSTTIRSDQIFFCSLHSPSVHPFSLSPSFHSIPPVRDCLLHIAN